MANRRHDSGLHGSAASALTCVPCPQCSETDKQGQLHRDAPGIGVRCRLCNTVRGRDVGMVPPFVRRIFRHWDTTNTEHRHHG